MGIDRDISKDILQEYNALYSEKTAKRNAMLRASSFFEPTDNILSGIDSVSQAEDKGDANRVLMDVTGISVTRDYIVNVLGLSFFQESRWFRIEHLKIEPTSDDQKNLNLRADKVYRRMKQSNYYQQIPHLDADVIGYGHGLFYIAKGKKEFAKCLAFKPLSIVFQTDIYGEPYKVMWEQEYDIVSLIEDFPEIKDLKNEEMFVKQNTDKNKFNVVCSYQELRSELGLTEEEKEKKLLGYKYVIRYVLKDASLFDKTQTKGSLFLENSSTYFKSKALFPCRDVIRDKYGRGIFRDLLPKARILNALAYAELEVVQHQYDPPLLMDADIYEITGKKGVKAGQKFIKKPKLLTGDTDRRTIEVLGVKGDLGAIHEIHRTHQEEMVSFLPTASSIYKTARQSVEEIHQRMEQEERKLAPMRSNYAKEAANAHVRRFYDLCERNGDFDDLPMSDPKIDASADSKDLIIDGFLLQKYREGEFRRLMQALNASSLLAPIAPHSVQGYLNGDQVMKSIWDALEVFKFLNPDEQVIDARKATVDLAERQQDREDQKTLANSASSAAKVASVLEKANERS